MLVATYRTIPPMILQNAPVHHDENSRARAFSAASAWTTPSCIQMAGTFSLNSLLDNLRHGFRPAKDVHDVDFLRHIQQTAYAFSPSDSVTLD